MKELAINQAQYIAISAINNSINEQIAKNVLNYDKISILEKDKDDKITAITTNMPIMNSLKASVTMSVYECLTNLENMDIYVPLGNLINGDYFSTRGPKLHIKVLALGTAQSQFKSEFTAVGVNQTRHRITLNVSADVKILFPFGNEKLTLVSDFVVMETILLGQVPESYTYIDDTESSGLSKFNDYSKK